MGKSGKKAAVKQAQANQKYYDEMVRDYRARTGAKAEQIEPFIKQLLQWGIDPQAFLQSSVGQAFLRPMQEATARNFAGARESLIDVGAGQGWSPATGIMSGPLANLFGLESLQQSANVSELLRRAPEMGLLGAQLAQGQQQIFNPLGPGGLNKIGRAHV